MLYLSVKYELLPIKCTHFTIRREIQNVNFFQATLIFAWRQNFHLKYYFILTLDQENFRISSKIGSLKETMIKYSLMSFSFL